MEKDGFPGWQSDHHYHHHHHHQVPAPASMLASMETMMTFSNYNSTNKEDGDDNNNIPMPMEDHQLQSLSIMSNPSFLNLNWDQSSTEQTANFESALSSLVSSPSSASAPAAAADNIIIRELIGRLGSICNSSSNMDLGGGENNNDLIFPPNSRYHSANNSCYATPLNSPPKPNLAAAAAAATMMEPRPQFQLPRQGIPLPPPPFPFAAADPGFAERAARFSCFRAARNNNSIHAAQLEPLQEPGKLSSSGGHCFNVKEITAQMQQDHDMITIMTAATTTRSPTAGGEFSNTNSSSNAQEDSSASGRIAPSGSQSNINRKRKATTASSKSSHNNSRGKEAAAPANSPCKVAEEENLNLKRRKSSAAAGGSTNGNGGNKNAPAAATAAETPKVEAASASTPDKEETEENNNEENKESNAKPAEPPKLDYIHVRARRGQATDSHSLAERVRREKISERMKFLQDLVPGCNKVTGKAVMLDEIINYVQLLQRQVEFLSMKMATVNPRLDFNVDNLLQKDVNLHHPRGPAPMQQSLSSYQLEAANAGLISYGNHLPQGQPEQKLVTSTGNGSVKGVDCSNQCSMNNPLDDAATAITLHRSLSGMQLPPLDHGFTDHNAPSHQVRAFWEDDLQSVVQMGFGQNPESIFSSYNFQGT